MKANELRIGNWVEVKCVAKEVGFDEFEPQQCNVQNIISILNGNKDFLFRPIPLTEEWLIKFGFCIGDNITTNDSFFVIRLSASEFSINPNNGVVWITNPKGEYFNNPILIEYAHQLQNLYFALTGEELNYKP